jgi:hypothetical protein
VSGLDQLGALFAFFGVILAARLLDTRPVRRLLRPHLSRLADWWMARQNRASQVDQEYDELYAVMRRQRLSDHANRLRRIVATDESMSATRQIANRIAYRSILHELETMPDVFSGMPYDETRHPLMSTYDSRRASTVEVLEIGWRR